IPCGLMKDTTLPDLLTNAGAAVAQATQDDVSLLWLQDQSKTQAGVQALENFKHTGTIDVYFQGAKTTLKASQVIDKVLADTPNADASLTSFHFGDPAKNSTTPDVIITLKPGFIWVGNPLKFTFKRAEHGGFSQTDTHVPLIVSGGAVSEDVRGDTVDTPVSTKQSAGTP